MHFENHAEKMRVEVESRMDEFGWADVFVYFHRDIVNAFKKTSEEERKRIREVVTAIGNKIYGADFLSVFTVFIDEEYGLRHWGYSTGGMGLEVIGGGVSEDRKNDEWLRYTSHNVETAYHFLFVLSVASKLRDFGEYLLKNI